MPATISLTPAIAVWGRAMRGASGVSQQVTASRPPLPGGPRSELSLLRLVCSVPARLPPSAPRPQPSLGRATSCACGVSQPVTTSPRLPSRGGGYALSCRQTVCSMAEHACHHQPHPHSNVGGRAMRCASGMSQQVTASRQPLRGGPPRYALSGRRLVCSVPATIRLAPTVTLRAALRAWPAACHSK
jgi:hypothetical protein